MAENPQASSMAESHSVKILEVCNITPSPSSSSLSLPTTFLDTFFFHHLPNERLLFYSLSPSDPPFLNSLLPKLKLSLSLALSHFLPLAGGITWPENSPDPIILYKPGDSVSLTVAQTDADFRRISGNQPRQALETRPLLPELPAADGADVAPAMVIQVTVFPEKGFSIGVTSDHATHDGKSSALFLKTWAFICKLGDENQSPILPKELSPVFDRTAIRDSSAFDRLYRGFLQRLGSSGGVKGLRFKPNDGVTSDTVKATFELTSLNIENLRKKVEKSVQGVRLSTFVLTYAYISTCLVKAEELDDGKKVCLATFADWRPRSGIGIPSNYFGNGGGPIGVFAEVSEFKGENGIAIVAKKIREAITELEAAAAEKKMVELVMQNIGKYMKEGPVAKGVSVIGSPRFRLYEVDFGWGKPEKVEVPAVDGGNLISLAESRDGSGGVEVGVALPKETMEVFGSLFYEGLKSL